MKKILIVGHNSIRTTLSSIKTLQDKVEVVAPNQKAFESEPLLITNPILINNKILGPIKSGKELRREKRKQKRKNKN